MRIGVPRRPPPASGAWRWCPSPARSSGWPDTKSGVEAGAGAAAGYPDDAYRELGVAIEPDTASLLGGADIMLKVGPPSVDRGRDEVAWLHTGAVYLGSLMPLRNLARRARWPLAASPPSPPTPFRAPPGREHGRSLSSMANITGYKGVLLAAVELNKYFPMFDAAGWCHRPRVSIGAGVAGLQAIATAKRLGAHVTATGVRPK